MQSEHIRVLDQFASVSEFASQHTATFNHPFYNAHFFNSLENSGATHTTNGWLPQHLEMTSNNHSIIIPGYLKDHSYGEYIFDWSIADAITRMGINYYPKWVMQFPFTPIPFPEIASEKWIEQLFDGIENYLQKRSLITAQLLYFPRSWRPIAEQRDGLIRHSIEFNWHNRGYRDFSDYLSKLKAKKAKNIRQERRKVNDAGYQIEQYVGSSINESIVERFLPFYKITYLKRSGHEGYLNFSMLRNWLLNISENSVIFIVKQGNQDVAASLMVFDDTTLYGRYWGSYHTAELLHFECCYYQGIEFCIKQGLKQFNPGVQGEHKVTRGFEPSFSSSYYFYQIPELKQAISRAFAEETQQLQGYQNYLNDRLPFKPQTD